MNQTLSEKREKASLPRGKNDRGVVLAVKGSSSLNNNDSSDIFGSQGVIKEDYRGLR